MIPLDDLVVLPKIDYAFKQIMKKELVRNSFIAAVLGIDIEDIKSSVIINPEMTKESLNEKISILDVLLILNSDIRINIEIQLNVLDTRSNRSVFYVSRMITDQENIDKKYSNIKKCISIDVLDFVYLKNTEQYHTKYKLLETTDYFEFSDLIEIHLLELPKLPKDTDESLLYIWTEFLRADKKEEFEMLAEKNEALSAAYDTLQYISQNEAERIAYTSRQKAIMDEASYRAQWIEEGVIKVAKNLLTELKLSIEDVAKATGLTKSQVTDLNNSLMLGI